MKLNVIRSQVKDNHDFSLEVQAHLQMQIDTLAGKFGLIEGLPDVVQGEIDYLNDGLSTYEQILKRKYAGDMESWGDEIKRQRGTIKGLHDELKVIKKVQRE